MPHHPTSLHRVAATVAMDERDRGTLKDVALAIIGALAQIRNWEPDNLTDENSRDWFGHVRPALDRLEREINLSE